MRNHRPRRLAVCLAVLPVFAPMDASEPGQASHPTEAPAVSRAAPIPERIREEWERRIGRWVADNSAYKGPQEPMDAYGIEWTYGLGKDTLVGRLYGVQEGREVGTFWEFREFWHPGEGRVFVAQFGSDGTYGAGAQERKADGSVDTLLQTFYDPTTGAVYRVGHRTTIGADERTTRSYNVSEEGAWKERRTYVWRRTR